MESIPATTNSGTQCPTAFSTPLAIEVPVLKLNGTSSPSPVQPQLFIPPMKALLSFLMNTGTGPDSTWRIRPDMGLPQQRPETTLAAGATQVGEEADLAGKSMRSPCIGLPCFRQGRKHTKTLNQALRYTKQHQQQSRRTEFFHWTLWIRNHHCHHRNSNQG